MSVLVLVYPSVLPARGRWRERESGGKGREEKEESEERGER